VNVFQRRVQPFGKPADGLCVINAPRHNVEQRLALAGAPLAGLCPYARRFLSHGSCVATFERLELNCAAYGVDFAQREFRQQTLLAVVVSAKRQVIG
jgi:hypothetical protein